MFKLIKKDGYARRGRMETVHGTVETPELDDKELPTGWHHQFKYFVDCVKNGVKPDKYQTFQSVYDAFKVIMAEQESIDKKQTIEIKY